MKFRATGRDKNTGEHLEMTFEAPNAQAAFAAAEGRGIVVEAVNPVTAAPPPIPHPQHAAVPQYAPAPVYVQQPQYAAAPAPRKSIRAWAVLFVIGSLIMAAVSPAIGFMLAGLLVVLLIVYFIPGGATAVRGPLGVSPGRPVTTTLKLIFVGGLAIFIFALAGSSKERAESRKREAEQSAAMLAEQQKLTREANAKVDVLMADVRKQFQARNVAAGMNGVKSVLATPNAMNKADAQRISDAVALSKDAARVKTLLVAMSDEEFNAFSTTQKVPPAFDGVYPVVTDSIVALAKPLVATIGPERVALAKKQAQEEEQRKQEAVAAAARAEQAAAAARKAEADKTAAARAKFEKKMTETLHVGYTTYCAWSAKWSDKISDNQFLDKRANANWLVINMTIRNDDKKARTVPPIKLIDEDGREYDASTEGMMTEDAIGILQDLNPDVSKQGNVIFDVPKGRTYRLKLSGGYWSSDTGFIVLDIK